METHYSWRRELQPTPKLHHLCYVPWGGGEALIYRGKDKKTKTSGTGRKTVKPEDGTGFKKKKKSLSLRSGVRGQYVLSPGLHLKKGQEELWRPHPS